MTVPGYSDREIADYGVRLINGEPLSIVPDDLRPFFERAEAKARAIVAAQPPARQEYPVLHLTPHVWDLLKSLSKAAGLRPGEWPRWLAEARAKDAAELAPPTEPAKPARPRLLGLNGHGSAPTPHPRPRHLRVVRP